MTRVQYGLSSYERARGDLPDVPVINMFAEEAPTEENGIALQSRSGLTDREADMGAGPVAGLFRKDNVLGGALFGVSAGTLYEGTTSIGAIAGSGPVSMDGYSNQLFINAGGTIYDYDGATLTTVAFPDSANVIKILIGASRLIAIRADTGTFYWTPALDDTFDGLDFATAESQPDNLRDALFLDDALILFGAETVEFWPNTTDPDAPFQPLEGRIFDRGIRATGCATTYGGSFVWVGNDNVVYANGQEPKPISKPGLSARIAQSAECSLFTFVIDGQEFLALRLDTETHVRGSISGLWSEFASYGEDNWIPACHADGVFGSGIDGRTIAFGSDFADLGGVMERRFRGGFPIVSGGLKINNCILRSNPGRTPFLTGTYADPTVEMRVSRDAGKTWGNWKPRSLGEQGDYRKKIGWNALGLASQPAFFAEWRVTAPLDFRVSDVRVNEPRGGR